MPSPLPWPVEPSPGALLEACQANALGTHDFYEQLGGL